MFRYFFGLVFITFLATQPLQAQTFTQVSSPTCTTPTAGSPYSFTAQMVVSNLTITPTFVCGIGVSYAFSFDAVMTMSGSNMPPSVNANIAVNIKIDGTSINAYVIGNVSSDGVSVAFSGTNWEAGNYCTGNVVTIEIDEVLSIWNGPCIQNDPLPIELGYFEPKLTQKGTVNVKWQTLTETNNAYFIISRSHDGSEWQTLAQVPGSGDTRGAVEYEYVDEAPLYGLNYYQLAQVDYDGASETFPMKKIIYENASNIRFFPNPLSQTLFLQGYTSPLEEVYLSDLQGNKIKLIRTAHTSGLNQYALPALAQGMYVLEAYDARYQRILTEKVWVQAQ
ncbi:T9SS type A sorting domain-containing protein [Cytophagales bacterium LB-30]|uniref:T9SS type A sorting domain-containing protein n=1 Tax=Shiella aurantiaca TaxID=3058365 RepID=A0ABT8F3M9_9BACT|nr:T9SS type A sorting domain-containing protein [Shiella aurantiaca]MDN4165032.1 T9SS type A sorting domain-containing protein [Shiella aurantiaca]